MTGSQEDDALAARAISARKELQARADAIEPLRPGPRPAPVSSVCDGYFQAAIAHFQLAGVAQDDATFFAQFQAGQAYILLGQACRAQVEGAPDRETGLSGTPAAPPINKT